MSVSSHFRRGKTNTETSPELNRTSIKSLVPQEKAARITDAALRDLEITMSSGELRDAVIDISYALIVQREHLDDGHKFGLAQAVINGQVSTLGKSRRALELTDNNASRAAVYNLLGIVGVVRQEYSSSEVTSLQDTQRPTELQSPKAEPPLAAA